MSGNLKKEVKEFVLHKNDPMCIDINELYKEKGNVSDAIRQILLEVEQHVINLEPYDKGVLDDINRGHWDLFRECEGTEKELIRLEFDKPVNARSPLLDVNEGCFVAIDFGTKNTVAGFVDKSSDKRLIKIGGDREQSDSYQNPTIIEFKDIGTFLRNYHSSLSRPYTSWESVKIAHDAATNLGRAVNEEFFKFFTSLKQWAKQEKSHIRVKDDIRTYDLKDFLDIGENDLNPIELYGYYIGRYVNNMRNGIYLNYLLSYPVKYPKKVREKIRECFERGLKKSIPHSVLASGEHELKVVMSATEPAAYAISALKNYGFNTRRLKKGEQVCYGVFDFGGGTTDFDFGMWEVVGTRKHDFKITHFGNGGDSNLGGENLLELLAYEIFKDNHALMRLNNCSFAPCALGEKFGGYEHVVKYSQEALQNTYYLKEWLRFYWENFGALEEFSNYTELQTGEMRFQLVDNDGKQKTLTFTVNEKKMAEILKTQISKGVENFMHCLKKASQKMTGLKEGDKICIFLAGNASRSPLVMECFEEFVDKEKVIKNGLEFFPPLGTPEADEKREEMGLEVVDESDFSRYVTGKTGVVFGLLDGRPNGRVQVVSEIGVDDEAKFEFYLGYSQDDYFVSLVDRDSEQFNRGLWVEICEYADADSFDLYYTQEARAETGNLEISKATRVDLKLDKTYDNCTVKAMKTGVNSFVYEVFDRSSKKVSNINKEIRLK